MPNYFSIRLIYRSASLQTVVSRKICSSPVSSHVVSPPVASSNSHGSDSPESAVQEFCLIFTYRVLFTTSFSSHSTIKSWKIDISKWVFQTCCSMIASVRTKVKNIQTEKKSRNKKRFCKLTSIKLLIFLVSTSKAHQFECLQQNVQQAVNDHKFTSANKNRRRRQQQKNERNHKCVWRKWKEMKNFIKTISLIWKS